MAAVGVMGALAAVAMPGQASGDPAFLGYALLVLWTAAAGVALLARPAPS